MISCVKNLNFSMMLLKADIDHAVIYVCTCFATNGENQFSDLELAHQHAQWF